jgi:hypothetical protein
VPPNRYHAQRKAKRRLQNCYRRAGPPVHKPAIIAAAPARSATAYTSAHRTAGNTMTPRKSRCAAAAAPAPSTANTKVPSKSSANNSVPELYLNYFGLAKRFVGRGAVETRNRNVE